MKYLVPFMCVMTAAVMAGQIDPCGCNCGKGKTKGQETSDAPAPTTSETGKAKALNMFDFCGDCNDKGGK